MLDGRVVPAVLWIVQGMCAQVLVACDGIVNGDQVMTFVSKGGYPDVTFTQVEEAIQLLKSKRLLISEGGRYLSLPIRLGLGYSLTDGAGLRITREMSVDSAIVVSTKTRTACEA